MNTVWKLVQEEYFYSAIRDQYFGDQLNHGNIYKANKRNSQIHMFRTDFFKKKSSEDYNDYGYDHFYYY